MKVAIVTGASRGLGRAFADQLLDRGYFVYAISRSKSGPEALDCRLIQADLSQPGAASMLAQNLYPAIKDRHPDELLLINNAGTITPTCPLGSANMHELEQSFLLNAVAPCVLMSGFLNHFQSADMPKAVVNISSGAAVNDYEGWGHYCATKASLDRLSSITALEQAREAFPAHIYSIYPGVIDTQMQADIREVDEANFPMHARFTALKAENALVKPESASAKILAFALERPKSGIYDIRNLST